MNTLLAEIKQWAESGLMYGAWPESERLSNMKDALEQVVRLCNIFTEDERTLTILKAVARGESICYDASCECLYCPGDENYSNERIDSINHKPECPILLARAILREIGTPLKLYRVTYDRVERKLPPYTICNIPKLGYTEDEVRRLFQHESMQNVQITHEKDM